VSGVQADAPGVVRLPNRQIRAVWWTFGALIALFTFALTADMDEQHGLPVALALVRAVVEVALLGVLPMLLARHWGEPGLQPWLELRSDGLDYGRRTFVPWANVREVSVQRRLAWRGHMFVIEAWRHPRFMARLGGSRLLPLQHFDRDWRQAGVVEALERCAPHVAILD
jgi:hypothetical protein